MTEEKKSFLTRTHFDGQPKRVVSDFLRLKRKQQLERQWADDSYRENLKSKLEPWNERQTLSQETVIGEFRKVHGDRYDYSKVEYKNTNTKVIIICPEHGEFQQIPKSHKNGRGCRRCGNKEIADAIKGIKRPQIEIDVQRVKELSDQGLTRRQIADQLGVKHQTLYLRLKQLGIKSIRVGSKKWVFDWGNYFD